MNNHMTVGLNQNGENFLVYEISDEALEIAGCAGNEIARNYTLAACTGLSSCPD